MKHLFVFTLISSTAGFAGAKTSSHMMSGFRYSTCSRIECVEIVAPQAHMSLYKGGFTTQGETVFRILDLGGAVKTTHTGESASYNPKLESLTLEIKDGSFLIYSLKNDKASFFAASSTSAGAKP